MVSNRMTKYKKLLGIAFRLCKNCQIMVSTVGKKCDKCRLKFYIEDVKDTGMLSIKCKFLNCDVCCVKIYKLVDLILLFTFDCNLYFLDIFLISHPISIRFFF